jgi:uncharacterized surface protein with fasciclin (FAS1) repeats
MENLENTDGAQALVAAIRIVDNPELTGLLENKRKSLILLAPSNAAFEQLLLLKPRALGGLNADTIARLLPTLLDYVNLDKDALYEILLKHVSMAEKRRKGHLLLENLLNKGHITVMDGSDLPVAIGGKGVYINYESHITERDVFTANGVIHYLDKVLVEAPVEEQEDLPPEGEGEDVDAIDQWCSRDACERNETLYQECVDFMNDCLPVSESDDECWGAALFMCSGEEI